MNNINPIIHVVQQGDTLYDLANMYGTTVQNIINTNPGINPYNLQIGSRLYIYSACNQNMNCCISQNQVKLLNEMNLVWEQHIMWTRCF